MTNTPDNRRPSKRELHYVELGDDSYEYWIVGPDATRPDGEGPHREINARGMAALDCAAKTMGITVRRKRNV